MLGLGLMAIPPIALAILMLVLSIISNQQAATSKNVEQGSMYVFGLIFLAALAIALVAMLAGLVMFFTPSKNTS